MEPQRHALPRVRTTRRVATVAKSRPGEKLGAHPQVIKQQLDVGAITRIPPSLEGPVDDPGNTLQKLNVVSPRVFWHWFHLPDKWTDKPSPRKHRYDDLWGKPMWQFLLRDELALTSAVPLVLKKKALLTGVTDDRAIRVAEVRALQLLRRHLTEPSRVSTDGLLLNIIGRTHIALGDCDYTATILHFRAAQALMANHQTDPTVWLLLTLCDLRSACIFGKVPMLGREMHPSWNHEIRLDVERSQMCKRLAMQCARALGGFIGDRLLDVYRVILQLHEQQALFDQDPFPATIPIMELHHSLYDICALTPELLQNEQQQPLPSWRDHCELLLICIKICAWEKGGPYLPRCGDVEWALVQRASLIFANYQGDLIQDWGARSSVTSYLWVVYTLIATAYIYNFNTWKSLAPRLKQACLALHISKPSGIKKCLRVFPASRWWFSRVLQPVWNVAFPPKGQWQVLAEETVPEHTRPSHHMQLLYFDDDN